MMAKIDRKLAEALWKIYHRPDPTLPWAEGSDLFWNDPALSDRILREHLDDTHGAASRESSERALQIDWLWTQLEVQPEWHIFDVTCGPGLYAVELARRGCRVTGVDFSPASIAYARDLAMIEGLADKCVFSEQDIRDMSFRDAKFDMALLLYGQLAVFPPAEARKILEEIGQSLKPGGYLCLELLNQDRVDQSDSRWWFTDESGLWGDGPFLHLGERVWQPQDQVSVERYYIVHLVTGALTEMHLTDQT
ncbi:MAG: class I SAM-dependent methyltransferase, partial [Anaerolineae bacterium]|nr:class I SAM-dependent methyltransferase [Anaerolineae bacterium]